MLMKWFDIEDYEENKKYKSNGLKWVGNSRWI